MRRRALRLMSVLAWVLAPAVAAHAEEQRTIETSVRAYAGEDYAVFPDDYGLGVTAAGSLRVLPGTQVGAWVGATALAVGCAASGSCGPEFGFSMGPEVRQVLVHGDLLGLLLDASGGIAFGEYSTSYEAGGGATGRLDLGDVAFTLRPGFRWAKLHDAVLLVPSATAGFEVGTERVRFAPELTLNEVASHAPEISSRWRWSWSGNAALTVRVAF